MMRLNHCEDVRTCTFQIVERDGCMWEHCADPMADGVTYATDDHTGMHEDCWRGYDKAWRHNHADCEDDMAAAQEDRYFSSWGQ